MNTREYMKARRARAVAEGLCQVCCVGETEDDKKTCPECLERQADYWRHKRQFKYKGRTKLAPEWCMECIAFGFHRRDCAEMLKLRGG
jgi:hypothetical protein